MLKKVIQSNPPLILLQCPCTTKSSKYTKNPALNPIVIEEVRGIKKMIKKLAIKESVSLKSIWEISKNINAPMTTKIG